MKKILLFLTLVQLSFFANASDYFWVGGTGSWSDFANHWATSSGGSIYHTMVPTPADNVFFDGNSFVSVFDTIYVTSPIIYCNSMIWSGLTDSAAITGSGTIQIFGSLALQPHVIFDCNLVFRTSGSATIQAHGVKIPRGIEFNGTGSWQLQSELDLTIDLVVAGQLNLRRGSLYTNGYPLSIGNFTAPDTIPPIALDLDTSHVWIRGDCNINNMYDKPVLQLDADSAILNVWWFLFATNEIFNDVFAENFVTDSCTFHNADGWVTGNANHFQHLTSTRLDGNDNTVNMLTMPGLSGTINGNNQIDTLYIMNPGQLLHLQSGSVTTVNNVLEIQSSPGTPTQITSTGPATISMPSGTVCTDYIYLENIIANGGATFYAGNHSFDLGGNSGWNWTSCVSLFTDVWPGDCNYDLVTNNLDLLSIGLAYGDTGFVRPSASLIYTPQACQDWNYQFGNGVNEKHADCDGNGIVAFQDTTAISLNYGIFHPARPSNQNAVTSTGTLVIINLPSGPVVPGAFLSAPIYINNAFAQYDWVYGIAFSVLYDSAFIVPGTMSMNYAGSRMVAPGAYLNIEKDFPSNGQFDAAITRINHTDTSLSSSFSNQLLGTLNFTVSSTASGLMQFNLANIKLVNHTGAEIPVIENPDSMLVGVQTFTQHVDFNMYPVPAKEELYLDCGELKGQKVRFSVSDALGQVVWVKEMKTNSGGRFFAQIPVSSFSTGVYFVHIITDKEHGIRRFVKE